jgi:hypothetical protein
MWLVLLQALAAPPEKLPRCYELSGEARAVCEAQEEAPPPPILENKKPEQKANPRWGGRMRPGQEFNGPETFTGKEQGSPGL